MYNRLNNHLLTKIYEYDNTYKDLFNVVLTELKIKCLVNPSLNNYDTDEWIHRISKWEHNEPTQIYIPTVKYKYLQQIENDNTIQELIETITYKVNKFKDTTLFSIIITTSNTKYCNNEAIRLFKVWL